MRREGSKITLFLLSLPSSGNTLSSADWNQDHVPSSSLYIHRVCGVPPNLEQEAQISTTLHHQWSQKKSPKTHAGLHAQLM
jgi:hypothetical protein